ncbi:hypothetical protein [Desulfocurvus sp. DL9XJH121]
MDIAALSEAELAAHVRAALSGPSGRVLLEFLRTHCFMRPGPRPEAWTGREQVEFRYGRMTLFQLLEHYAAPENFNPRSDEP